MDVYGTFLAYFLFPLNPALNRAQKKIYVPQNKANICNIVHEFMFQQRLEI